jgi:hypothetical protein
VVVRACVRPYYRLVLQRPAAREVRERIVATRRALAPILAEAMARLRHRRRATAAPTHAACSVRLLFAWATRDSVREPVAQPAGDSHRAERDRGALSPPGMRRTSRTPDEFEAAVERFLATLPAVETARRPAITSEHEAHQRLDLRPRFAE